MIFHFNNMHTRKAILTAAVSAALLFLSISVKAASLSGVLVAGGGIDDLNIFVQEQNGKKTQIYCDGHCGEWFDEDTDTEIKSLKKKLVGKHIKLEYKAEKNRQRIAGPDENEILNFLKKAQFQ